MISRLANDGEQRSFYRTLLTIYILLVIFGGFVYLNTDVFAYINAATALVEGDNIYALPHTAYTPLFYALLSPLVKIAVVGTSGETTTYFQVFAVKAVVIGAVGVSVAIGAAHIDRVDQKSWLYFGFFNPLTLLAAVIFGQADSVAAAGILLGLIGWQTERWKWVGFGLAFAAAIKTYPILLVFPLVVRHPRKFKQIVFGSLPVVVLTTGLLAFQYPTVIHAFLNMNHPFGLVEKSITPQSGQYLLKLAVEEDLANRFPVFELTVICALLLSAFGEFEPDELRLLIPLLPVVHFYGYNSTYRWLPLVLGLAYVGYSTGGQHQTLLRYASGLSVFGTIPPLLILFGRHLSGEILVHGSFGEMTFETAYGPFVSSLFPRLTPLIVFANLLLAVWAWNQFVCGVSVPWGRISNGRGS